MQPATKQIKHKTIDARRTLQVENEILEWVHGCASSQPSTTFTISEISQNALVNASLHGRCHVVSAANFHEIVVHRVKREDANVIF